MATIHDGTAHGFPAKLSKPALRALAAAGIVRIEQFAELKRSDVMKLHGMGPNAMAKIVLAMADKGLSFVDESRGAR